MKHNRCRNYLLVLLCAFAVLPEAGLFFSASAGIEDKSPVQNFLEYTVVDQKIFSTYEDASRAYKGLISFCGKDSISSQLTDCKKMAGGLSRATIFEFKLNEQHYAARLLEQEFDRQALNYEVEAQRIVAYLGHAPTIFCHDDKNGLVIMNYVLGSPLDKNSYNDVLLRACAQAFRKLHEATLVSNDTLVKNGCRVYAENRVGSDAQFCLESCRQYKFPASGILVELQDFVKQLIDVANKAPHQRALVHNDAHCGNIFIDTDGCIKVIDWADAGYDNPLNDCAIIINEYMPTITNENLFRYYYFSEEHREKFLTYYFGRSPSTQESAWFRVLINLYRLEMMSKILADPYAITAGNDRAFQDALYQSIEKYMHDGKLDMQLASQSGLMICGIHGWIEGIKYYMASDFLSDKELLLASS